MTNLLKVPVCIVDAFSSRPFGGNPAAVCLLAEDVPDIVKQQIAAEMNLSETAFLHPMRDHAGDEGKDPFKERSLFSLRWFTPTTEVPLCGHATLASAAVLFYTRENHNSELRFQTRFSGVLTARRSEIRERMAIQMRLPLNRPTETFQLSKPSPVWDIVRRTLGRTHVKDVEEEVEEVRLSPTTKKLLIRLKDGSAGGRQGKLEALTRPAGDDLTAVETEDKVRGVIVTVRGEGDYDFFSRYFAPWVGIPEDPVTGSAHTVLASYWDQVLGKKKGAEMLARQCSPRGGDLRLKVDKEDVDVEGDATVVLQGEVILKRTS